MPKYQPGDVLVGNRPSNFGTKIEIVETRDTGYTFKYSGENDPEAVIRSEDTGDPFLEDAWQWKQR